MKNEMFVSLWVGNTESEEELKNYVKLVYSDDGEYLSSIFTKEFGVNPDEIDEDYLECAFYAQQYGELSILLRGCSYEDEVILEFNKKNKDKLNCKYNSVIILYNYKYKKRIVCSNKHFKYIGCVKISYFFN